MIIYQVIEIWWRDIEINSGWETTGDAMGYMAPLVRSVGMVIERNDKFIQIIMSHSDDECNGRKTIPLGCIERITELSPPSDVEIDVYRELD